MSEQNDLIRADQNLLVLAVEDWMRGADEYERQNRDHSADVEKVKRLEWLRTDVLPRLGGGPEANQVAKHIDREIEMARTRIDLKDLEANERAVRQRRAAMIRQCERVDEALEKAGADSPTEKGGA